MKTEYLLSDVLFDDARLKFGKKQDSAILTWKGEADGPLMRQFIAGPLAEQVRSPKLTLERLEFGDLEVAGRLAIAVLTVDTDASLKVTVTLPLPCPRGDSHCGIVREPTGKERGVMTPAEWQRISMATRRRDCLTLVRAVDRDGELALDTTPPPVPTHILEPAAAFAMLGAYGPTEIRAGDLAALTQGMPVAADLAGMEPEDVADALTPPPSGAEPARCRVDCGVVDGRCLDCPFPAGAPAPADEPVPSGPARSDTRLRSLVYQVSEGAGALTPRQLMNVVESQHGTQIGITDAIGDLVEHGDLVMSDGEEPPHDLDRCGFWAADYPRRLRAAGTVATELVPPGSPVRAVVAPPSEANAAPFDPHTCTHHCGDEARCSASCIFHPAHVPLGPGDGTAYPKAAGATRKRSRKAARET